MSSYGNQATLTSDAPLCPSPGLIDIQINGAYNFDFSVYDGDDDKYLAGLDMVARKIVETGVTA